MEYQIDYKDRMLGYYPPVISNIRDFKAIIDSEYPEFDGVSDSKNEVLDNAYLTTMNEDRIEQWENRLKIRPVEDSTIEDRRETIIARIRGQGKLNTALISSIVNAFTGGSAESYIEGSNLHVIITPPPGNKQYKFANVEQELSRKVPAHLGLVIERNYETWEEYLDNTWGDMIPEQEDETWEDVLLHVDPVEQRRGYYEYTD